MAEEASFVRVAVFLVRMGMIVIVVVEIVILFGVLVDVIYRLGYLALARRFPTHRGRWLGIS